MICPYKFYYLPFNSLEFTPIELLLLLIPVDPEILDQIHFRVHMMAITTTD